MKCLYAMIWLLFSAACLGNDSTELSAAQVKSLVSVVNDASNRMMMNDSSVADVDSLFSLYSDDFSYVHETYGGLYTRDVLYKNTVKNLNAGRYNLTDKRYEILNVITGLNAAAVERREVKSGNVHLSVFEFKGKKVSKITEYWR